MSHQLEVLSVPGRRSPSLGQAVGHWAAFSAADRIMLETREADLLTFWLASHSLQSDSGHINWSAVFGLSLATLVSISIWAGIALAIASLWK